MHSYVPILRVTPLAGPTYTVPLSGYEWVTRAQPLYEAVVTQHELIDRSAEQTRYGFRVRVALDFEFPTPSTDETDLAEDVLTQALDDAVGVEVSLNNGTTYREAVLEEFSQEALSDKNIGVKTSTVWLCKDLIPTKPAVGSGSW